MPDYFVPLDTSYSSAYYNKLMGKNVLREFSLRYYENNKKKLEKMPFSEYRSSFTVNEAMLNEIVAMGKSFGVAYNEEEFTTSKNLIQTVVKATIARNVWDREAFYPVINDINEIYESALTLFDEAEKLAKN